MPFRVTSPPPARFGGAMLSSKRQCTHLTVTQASRIPEKWVDEGHICHIWTYVERMADMPLHWQWIAPATRQRETRCLDWLALSQPAVKNRNR